MQENWRPVYALPPLETGELHLWQVQLCDLPCDSGLYSQHLSTAEQERAARLRIGQVRMQFIVARSCLRILLGSLLGLPPRGVPIQLSPYGKPETTSSDQSPLFFNIAHSGELVLIALCRREVGIDVEYFDRRVEALEIARSSFSPAEVLQLEQAATFDDLNRMFFRCWTRKEAVIKAHGLGLSLPLTSVEVPVRLPAAASAVHVFEQGEGSTVRSTWFVTDLALGEEVAGAVATSIPSPAIRLFRFPLELLTPAPPHTTPPTGPTFEG